jgi:hypothetical protein
VTPDDEIRDDGEVWVVAISTQLDQSPAEVQVEIAMASPWTSPNETQGTVRCHLYVDGEGERRQHSRICRAASSWKS